MNASNPSADSNSKAEWPIVKCVDCNGKSHWRVTIRKTDPNGTQWHICVLCEAHRMNMSVKDVLQSTGVQDAMEYKKARALRYKELTHTAAWITLPSKGNHKVFMRTQLQQMFMPLREHIRSKQQALQMVAKDVALYEVLTQKLEKCSNLQEKEQIFLEIANIAQERYGAFANKGSAQHSFIRAASYSDTWTASEEGKINSYYLCLANSRWDTGAGDWETCRRIIPSKSWRPRHESE